MKKIAALWLVLAVFSPTYALAGNTNYIYDPLGRVIQVTYPDGTIINYAYDAAGNRTQVVKKSGS